MNSIKHLHKIHLAGAVIVIVALSLPCVLGLSCASWAEGESSTDPSSDPSTSSSSPSSPPSTPANPLKEGIKAFKAGEFKNAIGLLGSAQSSEFNNPVLHYYMANAFVRLGRRDPCIREYRIAYALAPDQEVGILSKRALVALGASSFDDGSHPAPSSARTQLELPKRDPAFEKALEALGKQSRDAMSNDRGAMAVEQWKKKASSQIQDAIIKSLLTTKKGAIIMPPESAILLERLREINDNDRYAKYYDRDGRTREVQKSADNLQVLLNDKKGRHRLVPHGTNLYVRNYQSSGKDKKPPSTTPSNIMDSIKDSLPK